MIKIETLKSEDLQNTIKFILACINSDFNLDFNPNWHDDVINLEKYYLSSPSSSCFFIAKEGNEIVGTIGLRPYGHTFSELDKDINKENTLSVCRHFVKKDLRGKGIGKKLFEIAEKFAESTHYKRLYLHTQKNVPGSFEYWLKRGFTTILENKIDPMQTVHMEKLIPQSK